MSAWRAGSRSSGVATLGQHLLVGLEESRWSSGLERRLKALQPGGVLLSTQCLRTAGETAQLLHKIWRALDTPPLLALEEEGGERNPLRKLFPPLPSPRVAAQEGSAAVARLGELTGAALELFGFNTNLAPSLNLTEPTSEAPSGASSFATTAAEVARFAAGYLRGVARHGILSCGKNFPGLGAAAPNRRLSLRVVGKPMAAMWSEDLVPYRRLLGRLSLVMVSHAAYKAYDFDLLRPATYSEKVVGGLLRVKLGYCGVALSADLSTQTLQQAVEPERAAVLAINAGCDMALFTQQDTWSATLTSLANSLASGALSVERVAEAAGRVHAMKRRLRPPSGKVANRALDKLAGKFEEFAEECKVRERNIA